MMDGYLRGNHGIKASHSVINSNLAMIDAENFHRRRARVIIRNPIPYRANHFGHKLHIDQNEKLFMYGVFHAACIDGFSSKIVRHVILPEKNNVLIYDSLYKPMVEEKGIWDMMRTDHGTEWALIQFMQNDLQQYRMNTNGLPFVQSYSKTNLRIERWWVEVNKRVNYPLKQILRDMDEDGELNHEDRNKWFIIGEYIRRICQVGVDRLVTSWNHHAVPHRGRPNDLEVNVGQVPQPLPTGMEAAAQYEIGGGRITRPTKINSIEDNVLREARDIDFISNIHSFEDIYNEVMQGNSNIFKMALSRYVAITLQYQPVCLA